MYSKHIIVGNVGSDAELRYTPSGAAVASFSLATNKKWKSADGTPQEKTTWYRVSVWNKQAETVSQYVTKGMKVLVEGEDIEAKVFTGKDGTARANLEIKAQNVRFLSGRTDHTDNASVETSAEVPF